MGQIPLNGLDYVRNEIVSAFKLNIDAAPRFAHVVLMSNKAVVGPNEPRRYQDQQYQNNAEETYFQNCSPAVIRA